MDMFGLDFDNPSQLKLLSAYFYLKNRFPNEKIEFSLSPSRRGYHFRLPNLTLPYEEDMELRRVLGDCEGRLLFSETRHELGGDHEILFHMKKIKGKGWVEEIMLDEKNLLSLPFWNLWSRSKNEKI